jgi:hypothetical protein
MFILIFLMAWKCPMDYSKVISGFLILCIGLLKYISYLPFMRRIYLWEVRIRIHMKMWIDLKGNGLWVLSYKNCGWNTNLELKIRTYEQIWFMITKWCISWNRCFGMGFQMNGQRDMEFDRMILLSLRK